MWFVIGMLLAAGPFAFPLLWKSSEFNRGAKWALTILFLLLTALAVWLSIESGKLLMKEYEDLKALLY